MEKKKLISIIIPLYNESNRFPKLFEKSYLKIKEELGNFELILVNDGSVDSTLKYLTEISRGHKNIQVVTYPENKGKGYALKQGVKQAEGEIIGFMDADFAVDLGEIPKFLKALDQGFDIAIGDRHSKQSRISHSPELRRLILGKVLGKINNFFLGLGSIQDTQCGFKFFRASVAKMLFSNLNINRWLFDLELILNARKHGYKIIQIPISWQGIEDSKVNISSDLNGVLKDQVRIYLSFFNLKIHTFITLGLLIIILLPFFINPDSLVKRNGDYSDIVWPDYYFVKESILINHQIPLWNPTLFSGVPEISNPQSPIIYPPNYLILFLPIGLSIIFLIFIHALLAGVFIYLTCRLLNWNNLASSLTSYAFIFSPFIWGKLAVGHLSQAIAIFLLGPILYFGILLYKKLSYRNLLLLVGFLALQYLNYPTIWYYSCFFGFLFFCLKSIFDRKFKFQLIIFLASIISILIISPIFLIQLSLGQFITRTELSLTDLSIPFWSLKRFIVSILIPANLLSDLETEVWLYPGLGVLILGSLGIIKSDNKFKKIIIPLVVLIVLITLGNRTPVFEILTRFIPGFSYLRVSTRVWFVLVLVFSFLTGFYLNQFSQQKVKIMLFLIVGLDLFIFSAIRIWKVPEVMRYSQNQDLINLLQSDNSRYYCTSRCLSARETVPMGVKTADGYHLLILNSYRARLSDAGGFPPPKYTGNIPSTDDRLAQPSAEKLGKFSVLWVISENNLSDTGFTEIKRSGKYILYQNQKFQARARWENYQNGNLAITYDSPNKVSIKAEAQTDGYLVLADTYLPGWKVDVDGVEKPLEIYDGWARKVFLSKGEHLIDFRYQPFLELYEHI